MRRGFTLLELVIVIIVIGVMATLGINQYSRMIEKGKGAEARTILGNIRTQAAAFYIEKSGSTGLTGFDANAAGIGSGGDQIPSACTSTHYFTYSITSASGASFVATASRCGSGGKDGSNSYGSKTLTLSTNFSTGSDVWGGTGGY